MNPEQIKILIDNVTAINHQWLLVYTLITVVCSALAAFSGAYLAEKARNTATREDIADITDKIEKTKIDYTQRIEELKGTYQLHVASSAKRLEALQSAFVRWAELIHSVYTPKLQDELRICSQWLTHNCIYLPSDVRDALNEAISSAMLHQSMLDARRPKKEIEENWQKIRGVADIIMREANLPPIPSKVLDDIEKKNEPTRK